MGGGTRARAPFRSSNYIFLVAQYSVLNCILNVQLQKASALRAGGGKSPSRTHPLSVSTPISHFIITFHYWCPPPPPPFSKSLDPPLYTWWACMVVRYVGGRGGGCNRLLRYLFSRITKKHPQAMNHYKS